MIGPEIAITIRPEAAGDEQIIFDLTQAAFREMPHSDGDEQHLINRLRADGDLTLSLVAEDAERIVGHIAISPVTIADAAADWFGVSGLVTCRSWSIAGDQSCRPPAGCCSPEVPAHDDVAGTEGPAISLVT